MASKTIKLILKGLLGRLKGEGDVSDVGSSPSIDGREVSNLFSIATKAENPHAEQENYQEEKLQMQAIIMEEEDGKNGYNKLPNELRYQIWDAALGGPLLHRFELELPKIYRGKVPEPRSTQILVGDELRKWRNRRGRWTGELAPSSSRACVARHATTRAAMDICNASKNAARARLGLPRLPSSSEADPVLIAGLSFPIHFGSDVVFIASSHSDGYNQEAFSQNTGCVNTSGSLFQPPRIIVPPMLAGSVTRVAVPVSAFNVAGNTRLWDSMVIGFAGLADLLHSLKQLQAVYFVAEGVTLRQNHHPSETFAEAGTGRVCFGIELREAAIGAAAMQAGSTLRRARNKWQERLGLEFGRAHGHIQETWSEAVKEEYAAALDRVKFKLLVWG